MHSQFKKTWSRESRNSLNSLVSAWMCRWQVSISHCHLDGSHCVVTMALLWHLGPAMSRMERWGKPAIAGATVSRPPTSSNPKTNFTAHSKEQLQHDFFCFWKFCHTWLISGGYLLDIMKKTPRGILENKMLTGVGLPFSEMPHGILCSGVMPTNTLKKSEVFVSLECCTWWTLQQNEVPKTLKLKADPHIWH
jgi:hypothetical protein